MLLINPGSGHVDGATQKHAQSNMQEFLAALGLGEGVQAEAQGPSCDWEGNEDGRWTFTVSLGERSCEVDMPGEEGISNDQRPIIFTPRLYVDGSSWHWEFALGIVRDLLTKGPQRDE